jgi:hypothetical protein
MKNAIRSLSVVLPLLLLAGSAPIFAHQPHDPMLSMGVSPNFATDQTLMLGTDYLTISIGVYLPMVSKDGGATYTVGSSLPNLPSTQIKFSPNYATDKTIFLSGGGGLFRSTNQGSTWTTVSAGSFTDVQYIGSGTSVTWFALTATGVYESTNGGTSFTLIPATTLPSDLQTLAVSPNFATDHTMLVGTAKHGIYRSTNSGSTWTNVASATACPDVSEVVISPNFSTDKSVFATSIGAGFFVSTNSGSTFTASNSGITDLNATSVSTYINFATTGTLVVTTETAGVYTSTNRGQTWTVAAAIPRPLSPQSSNHYRKTVIASTGKIILGMFEGVWTSTNLGQSWTYSDTLPSSVIRDMSLSPQYTTDKSLIATTYGGGVLFSNNVGSTWNFLNSNFSNPYPDPSAFSPNFDVDGKMFVGQLLGLETTTNSGVLWDLANGVGKAGAFVRGVAVSPNYAIDQTVLIGVSDGETNDPATVTYNGQTYPNLGMFLSTDGGNDWIPTNLNNASVVWIAFSPNFANDHTAFGGAGPSYGYTGNDYNPAYAGAYLSTDGGVSWTRTLDIPGDPLISHIAVSPNFAVDQTVYASSGHSGVYKSVDGGNTWTPLTATQAFTSTSLAISPNFANDQTLWFGTQQSGIYKSTDGGATVVQQKFTHNLVTAILVSPNYALDNTVIASCYRGVYLSTDGGSTFSFLKEPNREEDSYFLMVHLVGSWKTGDSAHVSSVTYVASNNPGDTATIDFVGSGISWIAATGPNGTTATVAIDGISEGTASFQSTKQQVQQSVFSVDGLACTPHTAVFTVAAPTKGTAAVNLDAVDILRDGCAY